MRRGTAVLVAVGAAFAVGAPATQGGLVGPCHKHYSVADFHRYARSVLPGPVTKGQDVALRRLAHCQRYSSNIARERRWRRDHEYRLTSVVYAGRVSVDNGTTVAGSLVPKCIALRRDVRNERFLLRLGRHWTIVEQCDWGPASWTGRVIDIHTPALEAMGVYYEPTDSYGTATLLR